jgi:hypothetical protein
MVDTLATPADLAAWLQRTLAPDTAQLALETATGWVQAELGQRVVAVANDTVTLRCGRSSLWLPEGPVNSVSTVTTTDFRGTVTARTLNVHYYVIGREIRWAFYGWYGFPGISGWPELATVTYSHGYTQIPQAIRGVCLAAAARALDNSGSLRSETVGGVSWTAAGTAEDLGPGLTGSERAALAPFRQLVVA